MLRMTISYLSHKKLRKRIYCKADSSTSSTRFLHIPLYKGSASDTWSRDSRISASSVAQNSFRTVNSPSVFWASSGALKEEKKLIKTWQLLLFLLSVHYLFPYSTKTKEVYLLFLLSNKDSVSYDNDDDDDEGLSWIQLYFESMLTIKETKPFKHKPKEQPLRQKGWPSIYGSVQSLLRTRVLVCSIFSL